jgi:DNA-3-methyladenine glycosylase
VFYDRPVLEVARDLLGMVLVREQEDDSPAGEKLPELSPRGGRLSGRIVEVEAYDGMLDLACHASKGRTERTEPMFGEAGRAYIYMVYGMHHCLNVVTGPAGHPAAVLLRALEPLEGRDRMARGTGGRIPPARIAGGPGRLTRALGIDLSLNRADLCAPGDLFIEAGEAVPAGMVVRGPRIGVDYAGAWARKPWRFGVRGSTALSRPFPVERATRAARATRRKP